MDNNNGPQPQPQNQMPPMASPPAQPPMNYNLQPKKSKAGLIVGIIAGIFVLVGIIVAAVVALVMFSGPSQEDYKTALNDVKTLIKEDKTSYEEISAFYGVADTESECLRRADHIKKHSKSISAKLDDLAKLKAVADDKEVKEAYDKAKKEVSKYISALDMFAESYEKIATENIKVQASYKTGEIKEVSRVMKAAISHFKEILPGLKSDVNKKFIKESMSIMKDAVELLDGDIYGEEFSTKIDDIDDRSVRLDENWKNDMTKGLKDSLIKTDTLKLEELLKSRSVK